MVWKGKVEIFLVSILITFTQTAVASGIITVQLVEYDHRDGKDADGKCCESIWSSGCKANECDPYFDMCLKNRTDGKDVSTKSTDRTTNVGHIHFGNNIGTTTNNIVLNFMGPLRDLDLNIKVLDSDSDGVLDKKDDLIEILTQRVQLSPTMFSQQPSTFSDLQLNGAKTSISLRYRAVCDQYYYGQECDVMCKPHPNYYVCDDHGNKLCLANWTGPNCDIQIDDCWCSPCLNGGTCNDGNMTYTCTCLSDYSGLDCELSLPTSITTTGLHPIANSTTRSETALHTNVNSTTRTANALHNIANSTTRTATALHTTANSTTRTATALHSTASSTRTTNALHNKDKLTTTTTTTTTIRLTYMTPFKKTTMSKHSLTNVTTFQISTRLPNVTATSTPFRQSGMHIPFSTTNRILQSDYQKWSPTIRINHVTISETKPPTVSIHRDPDVMTLLPIVGGAIAGTGVLLALCGLLTSFMKRRQKMLAELHKNNEDTRKLAWT